MITHIFIVAVICFYGTLILLKLDKIIDKLKEEK